MSFEKHCSFITGLCPGLFGQLAQLLHRRGLGGLEAVPLRRGVLHLIPADGALCALIIIQGTDCYTGRGAFSLNGDHIFSL